MSFKFDDIIPESVRQGEVRWLNNAAHAVVPKKLINALVCDGFDVRTKDTYNVSAAGLARAAIGLARPVAHLGAFLSIPLAGFATAAVNLAASIHGMPLPVNPAVAASLQTCGVLYSSWGFKHFDNAISQISGRADKAIKDPNAGLYPLIISADKVNTSAIRR